MWCKFHISGQGTKFLLATQNFIHQVNDVASVFGQIQSDKILICKYAKTLQLNSSEGQGYNSLNPAAPGLKSHFNLRRSQTWSPAKVMPSERGEIQYKFKHKRPTGTS
jgi:hypothetical protein